MTQESDIQVSNDNVFADLNLHNPDEILIKAELVRQVCEIIDKQKLTQIETAALLGIDQPKVSALLRGKITGFSLERLFRFLNALDRDVEIVVKSKPKARKSARVKVV
ncbi:MAG: hypothetical protein CLLPBCKN_006111 [Chroococcidiopsis cubana SAG 39.79]|uniref:Transcriptional regulator n=1 Tax=Chroococcidiopsis cubana SAG 39.79 TaxID=388085 RepID=A0AB37U8K9_9CYAN|nr:helix-turn-helix transcriptional regulator [Chroococcidiopsis cubana]MDZ4876676.1 hypothetical protein [Chroococcidiopsis cubana SAG 39.79]PSB58684.1 transcriptional regulator [Chroococcidiopsis cubana CCALA 043]RUS95580.1 transcriptional regulator [Chroococcidiopsis cubana SAG 39.79]